MTEMPTIDHELDCRGLSCPLPIIKTKKAIDGLAPGQTLRMIATDPGSVNDMAAWVSKTGHVMVAQTQDTGGFNFYIRKVG
ncbi:MAG: sulfurtransferase TusA family protein [Nitrospirae bacterium]|nr:sulfurtransferase TusA family protein [Nitrospirota bacterium]